MVSREYPKNDRQASGGLTVVDDANSLPWDDPPLCLLSLERQVLFNCSNTSSQAITIYYLNQEAISKCQQKYKSKSGVIKCPNRLVVPSK